MAWPKGKPRGPRKQKATQEKRSYVQAPAVVDTGLPCPHCGARHGHKVVNTYPNGNRRRRCAECGLPFVTIRAREKMSESSKAAS
jgi:hypothetical protein